ncbi:hypothetical protein FHR22_001017 [Sphingopyxis panaciterrae]|uniref:hypothetical protein n=1 Tax=Sphingopyxis panaciterrae TaxID=363841 RepID=UPI0014213615|nr:hypothetical protein [Sphingopyxis panaciterrae]NIJ36368.1 hypothetical protein [Sphingopyxis panaciterrae]
MPPSCIALPAFPETGGINSLSKAETGNFCRLSRRYIQMIQAHRDLQEFPMRPILTSAFVVGPMLAGPLLAGPLLAGAATTTHSQENQA